MKTPPLRFKHLVPTIWKELENIPRTGWIMWQIPNPETVAQHIENLRDFACRTFQELPELSTEDQTEILDMLEIHDWAESLVGDIALEAFPDNEHPRIRDRKDRKERLAMEQITATLGTDGVYIMRLWDDFLEQKTDVSKIARQIDLLQDILHAVDYEKDFKKTGLAEEFHLYSGPRITHYTLKTIMENKLKELPNNLAILGISLTSVINIFT